MSKYMSNGFRATEAEDMGEAAQIFASRAARRKYGRTGYALRPTMQGHAQDMSFAEFSAFIGYSTGRNETTGNNIAFTVLKLCEPTT